MTNEQKKMRLEDIIIHSIQSAPEAEPPADFSLRVMEGLTPRRPSAWLRLKLWLLRPQVLTIRPLQAIPAMAVVVALLIWAVFPPNTGMEDTGPRMATVRFILHDAGMEARNVSVVGSFNNWRAERSVMWYSTETRAWILEAQLPAGDHEYLFLVNGEKLVPDPDAPMSSDDGFGNRNSIVFVNVGHEQTL